MSIPAVPVVILAGGRSTRMGGSDKALANIDGQRMIDMVVRRLWPQCIEIFISGPSNYGYSFPMLDDHAGYAGPCAGVLGAAHALRSRGARAEAGFVTVPVDGPFLPDDLVRCLGSPLTVSAVARDDAGLHPTFAYWTYASVLSAEPALPQNASLRRLASLTGAREEYWPGTNAFANINTPQELADAAEQR